MARRDGGRGLSRPSVLVATVAGIGVFGLIAAAVRPEWQVSYHPFTQAPQAAPTALAPRGPTNLPTALPRTPPPSAGTSTGWLLLVAIGIAVALLALAVFLWWRAGRRRLATEGADMLVETDVLAPLPALRAGLAEAERRLLTETDPTDAIIAAWLALEEAAATSGVRRKPSQTPTEFTLGVIEGTGVDAEPVRGLLRLYHRARFSVVGSPADDLAAARRCISELAASWHFFSLDIEPLSGSESARGTDGASRGNGSSGNGSSGNGAGGRW